MEKKLKYYFLYFGILIFSGILGLIYYGIIILSGKFGLLSVIMLIGASFYLLSGIYLISSLGKKEIRAGFFFHFSFVWYIFYAFYAISGGFIEYEEVNPLPALSLSVLALVGSVFGIISFYLYYIKRKSSELKG
jgi:hypothetical protein